MLPDEDLPCDLTDPVQFVDRHHIFVRGNLEHAVRGSINDQVPGLDVLSAVITDNVCAGIRLIDQHFPPRLLFEFLDHFRREAVRIGRKRFR